MPNINKFNLSPRLKLVSDKVRENSVLLDVGTDHALLPLYLLKNNKIKSAICSDVKKGPLGAALKNIKKYGFDDKIQPVLSDGLDNINEPFDDIVIAGMGGELIASIVLRAPALKSESVNIILQPMTAIEFLRETLYENGFTITNEDLAKEKEKLYTVMRVKYKKNNEALTKTDFIYPKEFKNRNSKTDKLYLDRLINKYKVIIDGLSEASDQRELSTVKEIYNNLLNIREEMKSGNG